jgi:hypothetical protein
MLIIAEKKKMGLIVTGNAKKARARRLPAIEN